MKRIFFDADCELCRRSVHFILKRDEHHRFRFAPLKGKTAEKVLKGKRAILLKENTLILLENKKVWIRGRAVFRILWLLGGSWRFLGWISFLPFGVDWAYRLIARHRRHLAATSLLSFTKKEKKYFLS